MWYLKISPCRHKHNESVWEPGHSLVLWLHTGLSPVAGCFSICSSLKVFQWRYRLLCCIFTSLRSKPVSSTIFYKALRWIYLLWGIHGRQTEKHFPYERSCLCLQSALSLCSAYNWAASMRRSWGKVSIEVCSGSGELIWGISIIFLVDICLHNSNQPS